MECWIPVSHRREFPVIIEIYRTLENLGRSQGNVHQPGIDGSGGFRPDGPGQSGLDPPRDR